MSDTDTNGPDPVWTSGRMSGEEREWYEGWRRLGARFGRNVPEPVDLYGDPYSIAGCFVVIDDTVFTIEPVINDDGDPVTFSPALREELHGDVIRNVCERWGIPEMATPCPRPPAAP